MPTVAGDAAGYQGTSAGDSSRTKYVLCLIDTFSKWVEPVLLCQIDAKTVAEAMDHERRAATPIS